MTNEEIETLQLVSEKHPLLQQPLQPFNFEDLDPVAIGERLMKIMVACRGAGLSANQVGLNAQIFVMQWPAFDGEPAGSRIVINPEITAVSTVNSSYEEGCLSFPGLFIWLNRPEAIQVRYQDVSGEWIEETLTGWKSRIFQHEFDHLKGLTFTDRASKLKLQMANKKRAKAFKRAGIDIKAALNG